MTIAEEVLRLQILVEQAQKELANTKTRKMLLEIEKKTTLEAIDLAQKCLSQTLKQINYVEDLISTALSEVFGIQFEFKLEPQLSEDGALKGLKPRLKEGSGEFDDPMASFGASSQSIISICLRICTLLLVHNTAKILVLDEPLANVSLELQERFTKFIETVCASTDLQIVMVTHGASGFGAVYSITKTGKSRSSKATLEQRN